MQDRPAPAAARQTTLDARVLLDGTGVHGGMPASVTVDPAPADTGIVFRLPRGKGGLIPDALPWRRQDWTPDAAREVRALWSNVTATRRATELGARGTLRVRTVEHLMAALAGLGVDNAIITPSGPEIPILDGSALGFVEAIDRAGVRPVDGEALHVRVLRPVAARSGDTVARLEPCDDDRLTLDLAIDFSDPAIGRQSLALPLGPEVFRREIAPARTFGRVRDLRKLRLMGLARGATLDNVVGVDGARILNPEGLRFPDEFVRHKMLDAVGDLALAGLPIAGRFSSFKGGHRINQLVLRTLFAEAANFRVEPLPAAARAPGLEHG